MQEIARPCPRQTGADHSSTYTAERRKEKKKLNAIPHFVIVWRHGSAILYLFNVMKLRREKEGLSKSIQMSPQSYDTTTAHFYFIFLSIISIAISIHDNWLTISTRIQLNASIVYLAFCGSWIRRSNQNGLAEQIQKSFTSA